MKRTSVCVIGIAFLVSAAGCLEKEKEGVARYDTGPAAPECQPATDSYSTVAGPRIRITLNADGSVAEIEGKDNQHNWEPSLQSQPEQPESAGGCVTRIEVFMHDGTNTDLQKEDGESTHTHAVQTNPPYNTHCHKWVYVQSTRYLVHC